MSNHGGGGAMTQEEALLRAVLADPDDDAPRLIYADWLDEYGDGDRAEFIRVQCELARSASARKPRELRARERRLLVAYGARWAGPVRAIAQHWTFHRGFVDRVACDGRRFLARVEELLAAAPVQHLRLFYVYPSELVGCRLLERLRTLDLSYNGLRDTGAQCLACCPYLSALRTLDLRGNRIRAAGARALARGPYLRALEVLHLGENPMSDEDRQLLRRAFGDRVHF